MRLLLRMETDVSRKRVLSLITGTSLKSMLGRCAFFKAVMKRVAIESVIGRVES